MSIYLILYIASAARRAPTPTMSTEDPHKDLADSEDEKLQRLDNDRQTTNHNFKNWNKALEAYANGWRMPPPRYQVIISTDSLVSTPQKLQEIAGMTAPPKITDTTFTTLDGGRDDAHLQSDGKPGEVQVGEVSWLELVELRNKTDCDHWLFVWIDGKVSGATLVKSFKTHDKNDLW